MASGTDPDQTVSPVGGCTSFQFPDAIGSVPYNVIVQTQPTGQLCAVTNGSGTVTDANVTNVMVNRSDAYIVTGTASPTAGGSVTCTPASVAHGGSSTCTATANPGYTFTAFSGDCTGASCSMSDIQANKAVIANFNAPVTPVPTLDLWGLGLLAALAGALGLRARRRS